MYPSSNIETFLGSWISVFSWQMYPPAPPQSEKIFWKVYFLKVRFELADVPSPQIRNNFLEGLFSFKCNCSVLSKS